MKSDIVVEKEDRIRQELPASIREWVLFEAPHDEDLEHIDKLLKSGATPRQILQGLRLVQMVETTKAYCHKHPQAKYA